MEHFTWDSLPLEKMSDMISRKIISGDKAMVAQVFLKKDAVVQKHAMTASRSHTSWMALNLGTLQRREYGSVRRFQNSGYA
jgi:hypothetical protein